MPRTQHQSPQKTCSPRIREPLALPLSPFVLPTPPEAPKKPQSINWLQTLLPPVIMVLVLSVIASIIQTGGFILYAIIMMIVYPIGRVISYFVETYIYNKKEAERTEKYTESLHQAEQEIRKRIGKQQDVLNKEYLNTQGVIYLAAKIQPHSALWYRTSLANDFLAIRLGTTGGKPSFSIEIPKGETIDPKDPLLGKARHLKEKYNAIHGNLPFLVNLDQLGNLAIQGTPKLRYGLGRRILLDVLVHHRPDEVEIFLLSNKNYAEKLWAWLRWAPHCRVLNPEEDIEHLVFGDNAIKIFLGRLKKRFSEPERKPNQHTLLIIDVNGIHQFDDEFIEQLIKNAQIWHNSLLFLGGDSFPKSIHGLFKIMDKQTGKLINTQWHPEKTPGAEKDMEDTRFQTINKLDSFPSISECEKVTRSLIALRLMSSSENSNLPVSLSLFDVLKLDKISYRDVIQKWATPQNIHQTKELSERELLRFPIGMANDNAKIIPYELNLLESRLGGKDAYHTILIGTTGSGKSEFIKSMTLGAAYKYPPQYINFFFMDFKGGSTVDQLEALPHVIGTMTNLDKNLAKRGMIAISNEIDRRQTIFKQERKKDIWEYNEGRPVNKRMPHLILILDEFTRGLDMLDDPDFNLQNLLEKHLVPQGRSLGIYLFLANQVVNAKVTRLLPNIGWKIALRVASNSEMQFIESGLKLTQNIVGRGYIQPMGEHPVEFQSGYSGNYIKYQNIKAQNIPIKFLQANGKLVTYHSRKRDEIEQPEAINNLNQYLEISQLTAAISKTAEDLNIPKARMIYLPLLSHRITFDKAFNHIKPYRKFKLGKWKAPKNKKSLLTTPIGYIDSVYNCKQNLLVLNYKKTNPYIWVVGSQNDVINCLRTLMLSLTLTHSPKEVQIYMLEFGKGIRKIPQYPHITNIITEQETERVERLFWLLKTEMQRREESLLSSKANETPKYSSLFLIVNNIAGVKASNEGWYQKIMGLIQKESFRYNIFLIITSLPRSAGVKVSSGDMKIIKSRIVFPSINHDNYWHYLDKPENKLVPLTGSDNNTESISRSHWMCTTETNSNIPLELQLCEHMFNGQTDDQIALQMKSNYKRASIPKIEILKNVYNLKSYLLPKEERGSIPIGIDYHSLEPIKIDIIKEFPHIWGVSGPSKSGKSNFLISLLYSLPFCYEKLPHVKVFTVYYKNPLAVFCRNHPKFKDCVVVSIEEIQKELTAILKSIKKNKASKKEQRLIVLDNIHILWERSAKEIHELLDEISYQLQTHDLKNIIMIASFNYPGVIKSNMKRNAFLKSIGDNKTGICFSLEDDWAIPDIYKYKKSVSIKNFPGRGIYIANREEKIIQTFYYDQTVVDP